ncbi:hypothetical protein ANH9381_0083 [Aggregatibacter actinomycetemcomitans ANH9381]|nr:hypothetical protein ANH9381_0083 [Aggregatibacter actinomycetemcomitans ANH9381]
MELNDEKSMMMKAVIHLHYLSDFSLKYRWFQQVVFYLSLRK